MGIEFKLCTSISQWQEWDNYILKHERSLFNASSKFCSFFHQLSPDATPMYIMAYYNGKLVGVLPSFLKKSPLGNVLNSNPWFGSNPGVMADNEYIEKSLLQQFLKIGEWSDCITATIISRPFQDTGIYEEVYGQCDFLTDERIGMITPLIDNPDVMMQSFHSKTRNQIRKSYENCSWYKSDGGSADFDFLKIIHKQNMIAVDAPVKSQEFDIVRDNFRQGIDYDLYISLFGEITVAALLVKYFNKTVDYMTPAIDVNYRHLNPLHLLIFEAMKDTAKRGFKFWNWGGTKLPDQESVYHFKKRFGGQECKYQYYTMIYKSLPRGLTPKKILQEYQYFYVLPFSFLG
jgi:hypothetical protein